MQGWGRQSLTEGGNIGHIVFVLDALYSETGSIMLNRRLSGGERRAFGHISQNLVDVSGRRGKVPHLFVVDVNVK